MKNLFRCGCVSALLVGVSLLALAVGAQTQQQTWGDALPETHATMEAGVESFKAGRYEDAVASFRKAVQLEPGNEFTHLYLGTAYAYQVVPSLLTPENLQLATSALAEFDVVLKIHPNDLSAIKQEATIYRNIQRYDEAKRWEQRVITIEPNDAEAFYLIGTIDWGQAYKNTVEILSTEGLKDDRMGNVKLSYGACEKMHEENADLVDDGIANLTRAIELNPNYSDAMQYLQLTYERHADFACGDAAALSADLKLVDEWNTKAMAAHTISAPPAGVMGRTCGEGRGLVSCQ
jgi:tetratricopeptide (TPR) repeat protein